jgi:hypothetical protein
MDAMYCCLNDQSARANDVKAYDGEWPAFRKRATERAEMKTGSHLAACQKNGYVDHPEKRQREVENRLLTRKRSRDLGNPTPLESCDVEVIGIGQLRILR